MSDDNVLVPLGDNAGDTATLLLEAAEKKGHDPSVVSLKATSDGNAFETPAEVAKAAGLDAVEEEDFDAKLKADEERLAGYEAQAQPNPENVADTSGDPNDAPAKKATAKKAPAKKAAKKSAKKS